MGSIIESTGGCMYKTLLPPFDNTDMAVLISVISVTYYAGPVFPITVAILIALFYRQVRSSPHSVSLLTQSGHVVPVLQPTSPSTHVDFTWTSQRAVWRDCRRSRGRSSIRNAESLRAR